MSSGHVEEGWQVAAFATAMPLLLATAVYSVVVARRHTKLLQAQSPTEAADAGTQISDGHSTEEFITARGSIDVGKMAFSLYASVMGSWVVTGPPIYAAYSGILGLISYSIASGAPLLVIAWAGGLARATDPHAMSLPDFLLRRFGGGATDDSTSENPSGSASGSATGSDTSSTPTQARTAVFGISLFPAGMLASTLSALITLFVMCVAILAEYSTLGTLFRSFVGVSPGWAAIPTIFMGLLTIAYTVVGGLYISILTDRIQAVVSFVLVVFLAIYLASDFDGKLEGPLTDDQKGFNYGGYSSIFTMPTSLVSATLFSEALWQRVWAAEDAKALKKASGIASVFVILVVFFFGFVGFIAVWAGKVTDNTDPNLYFFTVFSNSDWGTLNNFAGLLALLCAALMSEGAVDSLQNGITATLASTLLKGRPLTWTRTLVLVVNIPLAIIGSTEWVNNVLKLFLLSNMVTTCCFVPLLCTVIPGTIAKQLVTEGAVLFGCVGGAVGATIFGIGQADGDIGKGIDLTWMSNQYGWDYFFAALMSSLGCTIIGVGLSFLNRGLAACSSSPSVQMASTTAPSPAPTNTGTEEEEVRI